MRHGINLYSTMLECMKQEEGVEREEREDNRGRKREKGERNERERGSGEERESNLSKN